MLKMPDSVRIGAERVEGNGSARVIHVGDTSVHFGFIKAGDRLPLKLSAQGKMEPILEAHIYVIFVDGKPPIIQTADQLLEEINRAVGTSVFWEIKVQAGY